MSCAGSRITASKWSLPACPASQPPPRLPGCRWSAASTPRLAWCATSPATKAARIPGCAPGPGGLRPAAAWWRTPPPPGRRPVTVLLIGGAAFGQVQRAADQRVPAAGGIGQGDRHLAQRDTARGAAVLAGRRRPHRPRTSHRPFRPRSAPRPRHRRDRPPTPPRCPPSAGRPRPRAARSAAAGAARDARPPRRSSSSCDLPVPSAARRATGRSTAGSPAGESTRPPAPAGPPAAPTGHHPLPWQQRLPHLDRMSQPVMIAAAALYAVTHLTCANNPVV